MRIALGVVVVSLLSVGHPFAHHAFTAEFDATKPVTLKGKVTKMEWINPHSWLHIAVPQPDGKVVEWAIECSAPNAMIRRGWNRNSIPAGTEVIVYGYRAKNGSATANGSNVVLPDGRKLFVGSSGTGAPDDPEKRP
jgi:hypothetical protein